MADVKNTKATDTRYLYRLTSNLSRNEEGGRRVYGPGQEAGDLVRLTPAYASRIGAVLVDMSVEEGEKAEEVVKTPHVYRELDKSKGEEKEKETKTEKERTPTPVVKTSSVSASITTPTTAASATPINWTTLSTLSYDEAVELVNRAKTPDDLSRAREAETGTGGKKRRSVLEAITAKEKELAKKG